MVKEMMIKVSYALSCVSFIVGELLALEMIYAPMDRDVREMHCSCIG